MSSDIISQYFDNVNKLMELSYENYISLIENIFSFFGKNREILDKSKDHSIETFNAFMSGYEKAKVDFGLSTKEPSDIYF